MADNLDAVSEIIWKKCMKPGKDEKALVVANQWCGEVAMSLVKIGTALCNCELMFIRETAINGAEPDPMATERMLGVDILLCPTRMSLTHTKAITMARNMGARVATLPGITNDMYLRCVDVDYAAMSKDNLAIAKLIAGKDLTITTKAGTDMFLSLGKRDIHNLCGVPRKGKVVNIPDGEACTAPMEGKAEGKIVVDAGCDLAKGKFTIKVEKGEMVDCTNKDVWKRHSEIENGLNLAELGIGTNPKAKISGNVLEDEKVKGTAHIAFGTNKSLGGEIQSSIHMDYIFWRPTILAGKKVLMKEGKPVLGK